MSLGRYITPVSVKTLSIIVLVYMILPTCLYGLTLCESQMKEGDFEYLDVVQSRLIS